MPSRATSSISAPVIAFPLYGSPCVFVFACQVAVKSAYSGCPDRRKSPGREPSPRFRAQVRFPQQRSPDRRYLSCRSTKSAGRPGLLPPSDTVSSDLGDGTCQQKLVRSRNCQEHCSRAIRVDVLPVRLATLVVCLRRGCRVHDSLLVPPTWFSSALLGAQNVECSRQHPPRELK